LIGLRILDYSFNKGNKMKNYGKFRRRRAFTLAEIMITLTIVGVVASMSIPNLLKNTNNQEIVAGVKKSYVAVSQSFRQLEVQGVDIDAAFTGGGAYALNVFAPTLNISKNCGNGSGCFPSGSYSLLNGNAFWNPNADITRGKVILNDGSLLAIYDDPAVGCTKDRGTAVFNNAECGTFFVDVNGFKGPNTMGRDLFEYIIARSGVYPSGTYGAIEGCDVTGPITDQGFGCVAKILRENAVNY